ncbi:MAG: tyrosine-protein phosphatase [Raoultibacter sp.]|jgi:protein-tyrosine phosphatase
MTETQQHNTEPRSRRIALENLVNTRDLGGIKAMDGSSIKPKTLIRSGALNRASDQDIVTLFEDYQVTTIIDLRTDEERKHRPDPIEKFSCVRYRSIPLLNGEAIGISRGSHEHFIKEIETIAHDPIGAMTEIYPKIVLSEESEQGFREFFNELLLDSGGAVLWHCSMGKDRVGMSTALLLNALGVPKETIVGDYLATNRYLQGHTQEMLAAIASLPVPDMVKDSIHALNSADTRFLNAAFSAINEEYGTLDVYMNEVLEVTDDKAKELKAKYLTRD